MTLSSRTPVPGTPPRLLPGRSALAWHRLYLQAGLFAMAGTLVLAFGFLVLADPLRLPIGWAGGLSVMVAGVRMLYVSRKAYEVRTRETRAGDTTIYNYHLDLWQLDPNTGAVLRQPRGMPDSQSQAN